MPPLSSELTVTRRIRLWPALLVIAMAAMIVAFFWSQPELQHQKRNIKTAVVLLSAGVLLVVWFLFLSRLRWRVRLAGFGLLILGMGMIPLCFRIRGVSGDLLPILEPRWAVRADLPTVSAAPQATNAVRRSTVAGEFPQFYGPGRDAVVPGAPVEADWAVHPPKLLWKAPVGGAWSGFAVKDGLAVTMEQRGESECVVCYDLLTGQAVWTHADTAKYSTTIAGEGPRTTPSIAGDRVYTFGATGILNCLGLEDGKVIWTRNLAAEMGARLPDWGFAGSPLLVDGKVVVSIGGSERRSLVACSQADGQLAWGAGEGGADYSSPMEFTIQGMRQIIVFGGRLTAWDLAGKELWSYPWPGGHPHVTPPLLVGSNRLWVASGYGTGSELLQVERKADEKWEVARVWKSMAPKSKFGPLFHVDGYLYGLDDGIFCCVDLNTGARKWKDGRYGHGQGLQVGGQILLTSEAGEIVLIQPDPEKLVELGRFKVFGDKTWNPPALAGEYWLMRNDKEAACVRLERKKGLEKKRVVSFAKRNSRR